MFRVGCQEMKTDKFVNGGILEQAQFLVCNASAGHYFHIYLTLLAGIGHRFVRFGFVGLFLLCCQKQPQLSHDQEQVFRVAGIATLPKLIHLCVLVEMAVGRLDWQVVPLDLSEVDIRLVFVVLLAGTDAPCFSAYFI